jgi:Zn-dependent protease
VYLAPSWLVFAAAVTVLYAPYLDRLEGVAGPLAYALALAFAVLLGVSVLIHEMSHLLVARGLGLPVRRITLFLLGGVTEVEQEPQTPAREYLVAVAGPAASVLLAGTGAAVAMSLAPGSVVHALAVLVAVTNGLIAAFNLLPGLPLDGGRVLRAGVWQLSGDKHRGTATAAQAGRALAVLLLVGVIGVLPLATGTTPDLANAVIAGLLAAFLWASATAALRAGRLAARVPALGVRQLLRRPLPVPADLPLAEALRRAHAAHARGLVVVDGRGAPRAVVSEAAFTEVPEPRRPWVTVGELARAVDEGLVLPVDLRGQDMVDALRAHPATEYVVVDPGGGLLGVVAASDVARTLGLGSRR